MKPISNTPKDIIAREEVQEASNPTFTEASERTNIASGESLPTLFGKIKKFFSDLKTVAFTNNYNDLDNTPTIPAAQIQSDWNQTTTTAKDYIKNKPTIPTVNNATLTIQKNGTNIQTFTANASSNVTCNIEVPTNTNQLTNGAGFITSSGSCASATTASKIDNIEFENNNSTGKNANDVTYNGHTYYTSNGPSTSLGASVNDGALYAQAYSDKWVGQIAQDYRNGRLFVRGKNNGTWQAWKRIANYDEIPTNTNQLTNGAGFITSSGTAKNVSGTVAIANGGTGATTRLGALTNLTNENVGTSAQYFLTITDSWKKGGYTSVANAKTVLGLGSLAYKNSLTYSDVGAAASSHTHSYLPLSGGTLTGHLKTDSLIYSTGTLKLQGQTYLNLLSPGIQCRNAGDSAWSGVSMGGATFKTGNSTAGSVSIQSDGITYSEDRGNGFCIRADSGLWVRPRGTGLTFKPVNASAFTVGSSRRYKENIEPLSEEEAKKILDIETVTFDYKDKEGADDRSVYNQRGVIAEQVEDIIPFVVTLEKVDDVYVPGRVDYSKFVPYLIKMCQIQQEEINELRERLM